jgi:hypothetical protein
MVCPEKFLYVCENCGIYGKIFQHELHLWIYYTSKFLNTSEFIIMIFKFLKKNSI